MLAISKRQKMATGTSVFRDVDQGPPTEVFHLLDVCKRDSFEKKVNMISGAYLDENGRSVVMPIVRKVELELAKNGDLNHDYLPVTGMPEFCEASTSLVLGENNIPRLQNRAFAVQVLGGTGGVRLGAEFLKSIGRNSVYIPQPSWPNHQLVFKDVGFENVKCYRYITADLRGFDFDGMMADLQEAPENSVVILHGCAHNPSGYDPTDDQWNEIAKLLKERKLFPFFDFAYQGFASGNMEKDAGAIRHFAYFGLELFVAQAYSKNFCLHGERVGALHCVLSDPEVCKRVKSQLVRIIRSLWSNPPTFGACVVATVLKNPDYKKEWLENIAVMLKRIATMRFELHRLLVELGTPGDWDHLIRQRGLFFYSGLNKRQVERLRNEFHIYLSSNGRAGLGGLVPSNVRYVADAFHRVVVDEQAN